MHNFDEMAQLDQLRRNLNWHCPRCGKKLSDAPIDVDFPAIYFLLKSFLWRLRHAV